MPERRPAWIATRLARFDRVGRRTGARALARSLLVAVFALLALIAMRILLDRIAPGVGPFAPVYPVVLFATLAGRLWGGLITWAASLAYVTFVTHSMAGNPVISETYGPALTIINLLSTLLVVLMAEVARFQSAELLAQREARIAERDMLLQEVDHRLKNNLAMLSGLLALQIRETSNAEARDVLARTATRLQSLSQAYDNLRYEPGTITVLDASVLIERLCASLREVLGLEGRIVLECEAAPMLIARDRASALALWINEVVTNAAKHAFAERAKGRIRLRLSRRGETGAVLEIADDGRGMDLEHASAGTGRRLLEALGEMAGGELSVDSGGSGTRYRLDLQRLP